MLLDGSFLLLQSRIILAASVAAACCCCCGGGLNLNVCLYLQVQRPILVNSNFDVTIKCGQVRHGVNRQLDCKDRFTTTNFANAS